VESPRARALVGLLAVVVAVVLFIALDVGGDDDSGETTPVATTEEPTTTPSGGNGGGDDKPDKPEKPEIPTIVIENGAPVGGVAELSFDKGDEIEFIVESDVTDHVHLHGYDVMMDVEAGGKVKFKVPATIDGVFEAELEESVVPIAEISVNP
jgi:hypothetical protein